MEKICVKHIPRSGFFEGKKEIKYSYTDMISQNQILAEVRKSVIVNKLKEFAGAQLVITDGFLLFN